MSNLVSHALDLFADYHQFYLQDELVDTDWSSSWTEEATSRMLAVADGVVAVGTASNETVPVLVELHDREPDADFDKWDRVSECELSVGGHHIVVAGCTDHFPDAARIAVAPGLYRVRVASIRGDNECYRAQLWRGEPTAPRVLKSG
jgi:hypothetical protein